MYAEKGEIEIMDNTNLSAKHTEDAEAIDILVKNILFAIERNQRKLKFDRTYKSAVKAVSPKGCVILDRSGNERTVKCCIPNLELKAGQSVWIKEPMGNLNGIHICGVV